MTNSYNKLVEAVRAKDWSRASEVFSGIMQAKVAIRLTEERRKLGALDLNEEDNPEDRK